MFELNNENKLYRNTVGFELDLVTNIDFSTASVVQAYLRILKPSGEIVIWNDVLIIPENRLLRYVTKTDDLNESGIYRIVPWIQLSNGYEGYGNTLELHVHALFS